MKKRYYKKTFIKRPLVNERIRAHRIRLINEEGEQIGLVDLQMALKMAKERDLDLVQVTDKVEPPVCKIVDYGKYLYNLKKKERKASAAQKTGGIKNIRLTFGISEHDLGTRVKQAKGFLEKGYKIRIEMRLRGRQKGLLEFAREKINKFLDALGQEMKIKVERELKREARGLTMIISKV